MEDVAAGTDLTGEVCGEKGETDIAALAPAPKVSESTAQLLLLVPGLEKRGRMMHIRQDSRGREPQVSCRNTGEQQHARKSHANLFIMHMDN